MSIVWFNQALIGVDRTSSLSFEGETGVLIARIIEHEDDPALAFSRTAGVIAAYRLAAPAVSEDSSPLPPPAPADAHVLTQEHSWSALLPSIFAEGPLRLQYEACQRLAAIGATLPIALLPRALEAGRRNTALRSILHKVLGQRGHWLAQFNADWRYAVGGTEPEDTSSTWEVGSLAQRLVFLRRLRGQDPAAARKLLQVQMSELPAKERVELIAVLEHELGDGDEEMLDALLKDRSREVRAIAARLLAALPRSAHAQRLIGWLAPLLTQKRGLLGKTWLLDAPAQADPAWQSAAIDATRPQHEALGERAWWLYQLVRQIPLSWWVAHTGMKPGDLIAWAAKGDWKAALYRGWRERIGAVDRDWIAAILTSRAAEFGRDVAGMLALLPVAEREKYWPRSLDELRRENLLGEVIGSCPLGETLSAEFSRALMVDIRKCFASDRLRDDYSLRPPLLELAAILHPGALPAGEPVVRADLATPALIEFFRDFERIVATRHALHSLSS
jgi:hypothetical protein